MGVIDENRWFGLRTWHGDIYTCYHVSEASFSTGRWISYWKVYEGNLNNENADVITHNYPHTKIHSRDEFERRFGYKKASPL